MTVTEGDICTGVVTGITNFGAFVKLEDATTGLVHISEIADSYVKEISDFLSEGDEVKVKVLSVGEGNKIALSIKKAQPKKPAAKPSGGNFAYAEDNAGRNDCFEDKLAEFMKNSNEKLTQLKRHQEGRRR